MGVIADVLGICCRYFAAWRSCVVCTLLVVGRGMFGGTMVLDFMDFADVSELADPRQLHVSTPNHDSFELYTNCFRSLIMHVHRQ